MAEAATRIKRLQLRGAAKILAINTYVIPVINYMGRFKLANREVAAKMWKIIRSALGSQANTRPHLLSGEFPPFNQGPKVRHPILFNWALLNSRPPMHENLLNPNTIGEVRREANQVIQGLCCKTTPRCESKKSYKKMARELCPWAEDLIRGLGCKAKAITYNLSHKIPQSARRCLTLLITGRWATNDKLGKIRGTEQACRACKTGIENLNHIFNECAVIKKALATMAKAGTRSGATMWDNTGGLLGLGTHFLNKIRAEIIAHTIEIIHNGLVSNNCTNLSEEEVASTIISKLKKRKIIKGKESKQKTGLQNKGKEDHLPPQEPWEYQGWYDGSGRISPLQGGAGYCVFKGCKEIGCGTMTIPFGTNNVGEFKGALGMVTLAKTHTKEAQIIGECEILTKAMNGGTEVDDPELNEILQEIRLEAKHFEKITFHHVLIQYNKQADTLATAASIVVEAGKHKEWDPRTNTEYTQDRLETVQSSARYRNLRGKKRFEAMFPIMTSSRPISLYTRNVQEEWRSFPSHRKSKGETMGKVRTGLNLRLQATTNPTTPTIQGYEWDIHDGFKVMTAVIKIKQKNVTNSNNVRGLNKGDSEHRRAVPPPEAKTKNRKKSHKSKFQCEWRGTPGMSPTNPCKKVGTVQVRADNAPLPRISEHPVMHQWNMRPGTPQKISRRRTSTTIIESSSPPMNDSRWITWQELAKATTVTLSSPTSPKGPFLHKSPD
jgi:ribonuclease HI